MPFMNVSGRKLPVPINWLLSLQSEGNPCFCSETSPLYPFVALLLNTFGWKLKMHSFDKRISNTHDYLQRECCKEQVVHSPCPCGTCILIWDGGGYQTINYVISYSISTTEKKLWMLQENL